MKISRKLSLAMFSLLIGACGEKAPTPLPIDTQSQLQALLETERTTLKAPGLVMAVQVGDTLFALRRVEAECIEIEPAQA